jgi:hypothetical protein
MKITARLVLRRKTHIKGVFRKELRNPLVEEVWHKEGAGFYAHLLSSKEWMSIFEVQKEAERYKNDNPQDCKDRAEDINKILIGLGKLLLVDCIESKYI